MRLSQTRSRAETTTPSELRAIRSDARAPHAVLATLARRAGPLTLRIGVPLLLVILGCTAAGRGDQAQIGSWGLVQALPAVYFVSTAVLTLSFFLELLTRPRPSDLVLALHVAGMVLLLHGAPAFLEQEPRFPTAWLHAGFADQILERGVSAPKVDARFNWPGFFGAAAAVTGAGGLRSALPLLRWAPVCMVLLALVPIHVIGRQLTGSRTAAWLGLGLFLLVNWVGQDYFAPQSLGFVLYLIAIAVLVTVFRDGPCLSIGRRRPTTGGPSSRDGLPDLVVGSRTRVAFLVLLAAIAAALSVTHQLSPIVLVLASTLLVFVGRSRLLVFPALAGILTLGWISVGTTAYWVGHLGTIFGGIGDVGSVVTHAVGDRIAGSAVHRDVVGLRLGLTGAVWALGAVSAILLWVRRRPPVTLIALAVAPFVLVLQDYGSEGVLRIYLFSAPFACLLIAQTLVVLGRQRLRVLVGVIAVLLVPVFVVTRYGNESFEQVRAREIEAVQALYRLAPRGSELVSPTSQIPWRFAYATDYDYSRPGDAEGFLAGDPDAVRRLAAGRPNEGQATYLIITTSQLVYARETAGAFAKWFETVRPMLTPENGYRLVYRNPDALIYRHEAPR